MSGVRHVKVFVEGYEDVSFWRGIFDRFTNPYVKFEISVPTWDDLPKGKKVLMNMIPYSSDDRMMCVDSDFDYLFDGATEQSAQLLSCENMFHTYAYATENYLCYAPSLHNVCVKATKNDTRIFDFEKFLAEYSKIIYPVFLWYSYSARLGQEHIIVLSDFREIVRLNYLDLENNGERTLKWLSKKVMSAVEKLCHDWPDHIGGVASFGESVLSKGVKPENTYLFMHGHTLMDNVVMILLDTVCDRLRHMSLDKITASRKRGVALKNELANYKNSLRSIRDVLLDNENYTDCFLFRKLSGDIESYIEQYGYGNFKLK